MSDERSHVANAATGVLPLESRIEIATSWLDDYANGEDASVSEAERDVLESIRELLWELRVKLTTRPAASEAGSHRDIYMDVARKLRFPADTHVDDALDIVETLLRLHVRCVDIEGGESKLQAVINALYGVGAFEAGSQDSIGLRKCARCGEPKAAHRGGVECRDGGCWTLHGTTT